MAFISYAQNFEDVMLWRALKSVENGFYVDVGAQHPIIDSVSKAFYERGWRGIHVEPVSEYAELLRQDRPDETVLQIALGDTDGTVEFDVISGTGLSTGVDAYAQRHQVERGLGYERIQVPVLTIRSALKALNGKDVHWMKIDVEGFEEKVLRGWDSGVLRPWIMVIEATVPNSPELDYFGWDPILTAADYQFIYFDGLNRFYLANEHSELGASFSCPPNVFDLVQLSGLATSSFCQLVVDSSHAREREFAARTQAHTEWLQREWDAAKQRIEELSQQAGKLEAERELERQRSGTLEAQCESARQEAGKLQAELALAHQHSARLEGEYEQLQIGIDAANAKVVGLDQAFHHWQSAAEQLDRQLKNVYASYSWRIMARARAVWHFGARVLRLGFGLPGWILRMVQKSGRILMLEVMAKVLTEPTVTARAMWILRKIPFLRGYLRRLALRGGLITTGGEAIARSSSRWPQDQSEPVAAPAVAVQAAVSVTEPTSLSPTAARIYGELKRALDAGKH